jgi:hypothetical protein
MRESFVFYKSFYQSIKELDTEYQVEIYNAIFEFEFNGKVPDLSGVSKSIFTLIIPQLEANNKRYENGKKGGRPTTKAKPNNNQTITKAKPNVNDNVNVNVNVNDNVNKNMYFEKLELNNIFLEFLQIRKKLKAVNSDRAIKMLIKKLNTYDDETKYKMIEQSIVHSWKDVYEIKEHKKQETVPKWFDEEIKEEQLSKEEEQEIEELLKEFN